MNISTPKTKLQFLALAALKNSLSEGKNIFTGTFKALFALPAKIPDLVQATFGGGERDPEGLVGVVGVARVSGDAAASENAGWAAKIGFFLLIIASLNIFIGISAVRIRFVIVTPESLKLAGPINGLLGS